MKRYLWSSAGLLLLIVGLPLTGFTEPPSLVLGRGAERIVLSEEKHEVSIRFFDPQGRRLVLEQYLVSPLRDERGKVYTGLVCSWVKFESGSTGRIDWVDGEVLSTSPKQVFTGIGTTSTETRLRLTYDLCGRCSAERITGVLGLVLYPEGSPNDRVIYSIPIEISCRKEVLRILRLSDGREVIVRTDKIGFVELEAHSPVTLLKGRDLPSLEVRFVWDDGMMDWQTLTRVLRSPRWRGKGRIEFRPSKGTEAGRWTGVLVLESQGDREQVPVVVEVKRKFQLEVLDSKLEVKVDPEKGVTTLGEVILKIISNLGKTFSVVQEMRGSGLVGEKGEVIRSEFVEYAVYEEKDGKWVEVRSWTPIKGGQQVLFRSTSGIEKEVKLKVVYRVTPERINDLVAGSYRLPLRFSVVLD